MNQLTLKKLNEIFQDRVRYLRLPWSLKWHEGIAYLHNKRGDTLARFTMGSADDCEAAIEAVNAMPEMLETYQRQVEIITYLRPEVLRFAMAMEKELRQNDHKGGWKSMGNPGLLVRLHEEMEELRCVLDNDRPAREILSESADVANFAMMLADNAGMMDVPIKEIQPECLKNA